MSVGFTRPGAAYEYRSFGGSVDSSNASVSIDAVAGEFTVVRSTLINKTILLVARTGSIFKPVTGTPGDREYSYDSATGTFTFSVAFNDNEDVYIQYK
jgi:hypothetical protein